MKENEKSQSENNKNEEPSEENDQFQMRIKEKIINFFEFNNNLSIENFNEFMNYIGLAEIFNGDSMKKIWETFRELAENKEILDKNESINAVLELLNFYLSDGQETQEEKENPSEDENKYQTNSDYKMNFDNNENNEDERNDISFSGVKAVEESTNENYNMIRKDSPQENISFLRSSTFNSNNQEIIRNRSRNNSFVFLKESNKELTGITNNNENEATSKIIKAPRHKRQITKIFKEIDIETLKQLRRVFSLLDIKNKNTIQLKEIDDILKYKFINLTKEEMYFFISNLSYDNDEEKQTNIQALSKKGMININFELYSRAISAIEQKILNENFEDFQEYLNDSYEIKENFAEVFESINILENESKDFISVLADIFISMRQKYELESSEINININSIAKNFKNLDANKNNSKSEEEKRTNFSSAIESIKNEVAFYFKCFQDKSQDIEFFLKDLNKNYISLENKINLLKLISEKYERQIKVLDEDYRDLFEKYNTSQPLEVNDDLEKLLEENIYLNNEIENKNYQIEQKSSEIKDREDKVFSLEIEIEKIKKKNSQYEIDLNKTKRSYEEVQSDYEKLRNELYEEMIKEDFNKSNKNNKDYLSNNSFEENNEKNPDFIKQSFLFKEKLLKEEKEKANKYLEMSYEKLILYSLEVDKANNNFNTIFSNQENTIKKLEEEIEKLNKLLNENSKQNYLLSIENGKLTSKIADIQRESDFNKGFRPSTLLSNRISDLRGTLRQSTNSSISNNNSSKSNGFFAFDKNKMLKNFTKEKNRDSSIKNIYEENNNNQKNEFSSMLKKSENIFDKREDYENEENSNKNESIRNSGDSIKYNKIETNGDFRISTLNYSRENSFEDDTDKNKYKIQQLSRESNDFYNNFDKMDSDNFEIDNNENNEKISFEKENNENDIKEKKREKVFSSHNFEPKTNLAFSLKNNEDDSGRKTLNNENFYSPFALDKEKASINNDNNQKDENIEFNRNEQNKYKSIGGKIDEDKKLKNVSSRSKKSKSNYLNDQSKLFASNFSADFYKEKKSITNTNDGIINDFARNSDASFKFEETYNNEESDIINNVFDFSGKRDKEENQVIVDDIENFDINESENSNKNEYKIETQSLNNLVSVTNINNKDQKKQGGSSVPFYGKNKGKQIKQISEGIIEDEEDEERDEINDIDENNEIGTSALPTHNRNYTLDLDKEFTKPSEYMCYDFLTMRKNVAIINMLDKYNEAVSSYEMFSENVHFFDDQKKKTKRYLFITCNAIYILRPYDISEKVRIPLRQITKITISNKNCNLLVFHFANTNTDDMMIEILRRMELLYYFRDLFRMKSLGKLRLRYSDNFKVKQGGMIKNITIDQSNNLFIAPNFENAQKLAYIEKLSGGFFSRFKEKLVVLSNIGLMYFNDPKEPPRKLIPILGSEILSVDEKKHSKKNCFEIKTLNNEVYVFAVKTKDDLESWIKEFKTFKVNYQKMVKGVDDKKGKQ